MTDENTPLDQEEDFDIDNLDFSEESVEAEEVVEETVKQEDSKYPSAIDDDRVKLLESELKAAREEATQAAKEREEAWEETEKTRTAAISGQIQQWQSDLARENREMVILQQQYARAQAEQDVDKQSDLIAKHSERQQLIGQLQNNIGNAQHQLSAKPVRAVKEVVKVEPPKRSAGEQMADKWAAENPWYNDPARMKDRQLVDDLCKKAMEAKYDPASLKFWNYIDREVEAANSKRDAPRRTPPAARPVANKGGSQSMSTNNRNKPDPDILKAAHLALDRRGIAKGHPEFEKLQKSYYGTFKREIDKAKQNG